MKLLRGHWAYNLFGLLFFIAVFYLIKLPNRISSGLSQRNTCIANLKQIDGAIQQWALVNGIPKTNKVVMAGALKFLKGGEQPRCPCGGVYSPGRTVDDPPICSKAVALGHSLP